MKMNRINFSSLLNIYISFFDPTYNMRNTIVEFFIFLLKLMS